MAVISYLMASQCLSYDAALALAQERRKMAEPNPTFAAMLRAYAASDALKQLQAELAEQPASSL